VPPALHRHHTQPHSRPQVYHLTLVTTTATAASAAHLTTTTSGCDNNNHTGLTSDAIAGIAVGAAAGVSLLVAAIFFGVGKRKSSAPVGLSPQAYTQHQYRLAGGPTGYALPVISEDYSRFLPSYTQQQTLGQPQFRQQYQEPHSPSVQRPYMGPESEYMGPRGGNQ